MALAAVATLALRLWRRLRRPTPSAVSAQVWLPG